jgi:O-antigen/teichoic acid export membrane protein
MFTLAAIQAKRTQWLMLVSFLALTANTILNFALIPHWGMYGAAYATVGAYIVEALVMYFVAQRLYGLQYDMQRVISACGVFVIALAATQIYSSADHRLLALAAAGALCFVLLASLGLKEAISLVRNRTQGSGI